MARNQAADVKRPISFAYSRAGRRYARKHMLQGKSLGTHELCQSKARASNSEPDSYVEILEIQHSQLIFGLQKLYLIVEEGKEWTVLQPRRTMQGNPFCSDSLDALGAFKEGHYFATHCCSDDDAWHLRSETSVPGIELPHSVQPA